MTIQDAAVVVDYPEIELLDPDDSSRLAFLTYAHQTYPRSPLLKVTIDALKTPTAKEIANEILYGNAKDQKIRALADVYRSWIDENS